MTWYRLKLSDGMCKSSRASLYVEASCDHTARERAVDDHPDGWFTSVVSSRPVGDDYETVETCLRSVTCPNLAIHADGTLTRRSDLE